MGVFLRYKLLILLILVIFTQYDINIEIWIIFLFDSILLYSILLYLIIYLLYLISLLSFIILPPYIILPYINCTTHPSELILYFYYD